MGYDIDYEYEFDLDNDGLKIIPEGTKMTGDLYVLPNGKYMPPGVYSDGNGMNIIYEPRMLSPWADAIAECTEE